MALNLKALIQLVVPEYLLVTVLTTISASLLIEGQKTSFLIIFAIISLSFAMFGFNTLNMIFDYHLDSISKPERPLPKNKISEKNAVLLSVLFNIFALAFGMLAGAKFLFVLFLFLTISFLYTYPRIYLKRFIFASPVIGGIIYGAIPFLAAWSLGNRPINLPFLAIFTGLVACIAPSKDIEDIEGEKRHGVMSIPIVIGIRNTFSVILIGLAVILLGVWMAIYFKTLDKIFVYPSVAFLLIIIFLAQMYSKEISTMNMKSDKSIITHANIVTYSILSVILVQLCFGITNLFFG